MNLITPQYRELNRQLHVSPEYGTTAGKFVNIVQELTRELGTKDILDYGCGKGTLQECLGYPITNYDPCIYGLDAPPRPHAIVVCIDVLEHIEPECLNDVLADLRRVTRQAMFATIATKPAHKMLEDGRNAHLIVEKQAWWIPKIWAAGFTIRGLTDTGRRIQFVAI